jgi:dihydrofolate reductase
MRKLIYFAMVSLDGKIETAERSLEWVVMDAELHRFINNLERQAGEYLYGRRMYEMMHPYWSTADALSDQAIEREFSVIWKQIPKRVFSQTLEKVEGNAHLVRGDVVEEVTRLKSQPGGDLEVGGAELAGSLMHAGLIDEYRLFVQPVILGAGTPMITPLDRPVKLRLVEEHPFQCGAVYLRYLVEREQEQTG